VGIISVRGCEVEGLLDDKGRLFEDQEDAIKFKGDDRAIRVWLDCNQHHRDSVDGKFQLNSAHVPDELTEFVVCLIIPAQYGSRCSQHL
jgi:hypothetical protein